jgi:ADP-ribosylglycohydrolase
VIKSLGQLTVKYLGQLTLKQVSQLIVKRPGLLTLKWMGQITVKYADFPLFNQKCDFTDDTVLTIAVADSILNNKEFSKTIWEYDRKYTSRGYGLRFGYWLNSTDPKPYNGYSNGSAMRVSSVGFAYNDLSQVLDFAKQ